MKKLLNEQETKLLLNAVFARQKEITTEAPQGRFGGLDCLLIYSFNHLHR